MPSVQALSTVRSFASGDSPQRTGGNLGPSVHQRRRDREATRRAQRCACDWVASPTHQDLPFFGNPDATRTTQTGRWSLTADNDPGTYQYSVIFTGTVRAGQTMKPVEVHADGTETEHPGVTVQ